MKISNRIHALRDKFREKKYSNSNTLKFNDSNLCILIGNLTSSNSSFEFLSDELTLPIIQYSLNFTNSVDVTPEKKINLIKNINKHTLHNDIIENIIKFLPDNLAINNCRLTNHQFKNLTDKHYYARFFTPTIISYVLTKDKATLNSLLNTNKLYFNFVKIKQLNLQTPVNQAINNILIKLKDNYNYNISFQDEDFNQTLESLEILNRILRLKSNITINLNFKNCRFTKNKSYLLSFILYELINKKKQINIKFSKQQITQLLIDYINNPCIRKLHVLQQVNEIYLDIEAIIKNLTNTDNLKILISFLKQVKVKALIINFSDKNKTHQENKENLNYLLKIISENIEILAQLNTLDLSMLNINILNIDTLCQILARSVILGVKNIFLNQINSKIFYAILEQLKLLPNIMSFPNFTAHIDNLNTNNYIQYLNYYSEYFMQTKNYQQSYNNTIKKIKLDYRAYGINFENTTVYFSMNLLQHANLLNIEYGATQEYIQYNAKLLDTLGKDKSLSINIDGIDKEDKDNNIYLDNFLVLLAYYCQENNISIYGLEINNKNNLNLEDFLKNPKYLTLLLEKVGKNLQYINIAHEVTTEGYKAIVEGIKKSIDFDNLPNQENLVSNLQYLSFKNLQVSSNVPHPINELKIILPQLEFKNN